MELEFNKVDNFWVAQFQAADDFNLHLERDTEGSLYVMQKTAGEKYEIVNNTGWLDKRLVYDQDFTGVVYPKTIMIKSLVKPQVAIVTFA